MLPAPSPTPAPPAPAPELETAPINDRHTAIQMASNSVLTPVSETPPETTTTASTTPRSNKWARFQGFGTIQFFKILKQSPFLTLTLVPGVCVFLILTKC